MPWRGRTGIGTERRPGRAKQVVWEELDQGSMGGSGWVPKQREVFPFNALVLQTLCSLNVFYMNTCMWNNTGRKKWCWVSQAISSLIVYWWAALGNASGRWSWPRCIKEGVSVLEQPSGQGCTCMGSGEGLRKLALGKFRTSGREQRMNEARENRCERICKLSLLTHWLKPHEQM